MPQEFEYDGGAPVGELEKAVLVGLASPVLGADESSDEDTLDELEALLETAGGVCAARMLQNRATPDARTFIGKGKAREAKELAEQTGATLLLLDNDLAPAQARALEEETGLRVMDRSGVILDIFASRARSKEGRLQVELAQYKYVLPRLAGMWTHLARQTASGGSSPIGTRGPGETQLETDRRHIRSRLEKLDEELKEVKRTRAVQRSLRQRNRVPVVALVGYTNAGKSTLMNALTGAGIPANDRLFDTLDTTTRKLDLGGGREALLSDTVGFIRKLPHHLVQAFSATLEELCYADVILHVIDVSDPQHQAQEEVASKLINQLGAGQIPLIRVYNKADLSPVDLPRESDAVSISALGGRNLDLLKEKICEALDGASPLLQFVLPYDKAGQLDNLYRSAQVESAEYTDAGIEITARFTGEAPGWVLGLVKKDNTEDIHG